MASIQAAPYREARRSRITASCRQREFARRSAAARAARLPARSAESADSRSPSADRRAGGEAHHRWRDRVEVVDCCLLLGQTDANLLVEDREVLIWATSRSGAAIVPTCVHQHVDRATGGREPLELPFHEQQRLGPHRQPVALVDVGGTIRLIVPCSSSSSTNTTPPAVPGRWRATTRPPTRTRLPCASRSSSRLSTLPAGRRSRSSASGWARDGQAGGAVVGEHRLPRRQLAQLRRRRQVERERELHAAGHAASRGRDAELPQRQASGDAGGTWRRGGGALSWP